MQPFCTRFLLKKICRIIKTHLPSLSPSLFLQRIYRAFFLWVVIYSQCQFGKVQRHLISWPWGYTLHDIYPIFPACNASRTITQKTSLYFYVNVYASVYENKNDFSSCREQIDTFPRTQKHKTIITLGHHCSPK